MSIRCRSFRRRKLCVFSIFVTASFTYLLLLKLDIVCTNLAVQRALDDLCRQHKEGQAVGNLCSAMCVDKTVVPVSCQTFHAAKEVVFSAKWRDIDVFIKSQKQNFLLDEDNQVYLVDSNQVKHYPSLPEFRNMVKKTLEVNLNFTLKGDLLQKLWPLPLESQKKGAENKHLLSAMSNIWALIQDNEYVFSKLFEEFNMFPQVYGTCGSFYVVEKVELVTFPPYFNSDSFTAWVWRAKTALLILDLLQELDQLLQQPIHLCDIKIDHFGFTADRIKYLDLDTIFPRSVIDQSVGDGSRCTKHADCNFFDCKSRCNRLTNRCDQVVTNNNLQVVCEKIFLRKQLHNLFGFPGLLTSPHVTRHFISLLERCSNPNNQTDTRAAAPDSVRQTLYSSLSEIVDFGRRLHRN